MKALLLSFFAVILCYSLFFEGDEPQTPVDEVNYTIRSEAYDRLQTPDTTIMFYAKDLSKPYL